MLLMHRFLKNHLRFYLFIFVSYFCFISSILALSPEKRLDNPQHEARAQELFLQVRCLICSGQVIESSDNEFAHSMRQLIRQKISQNKSNEEIKKELIQKYGNDILLEVGFLNRNGFILWFLPIFISAFVIIKIFLVVKNKGLSA